jgi:hypothetical protein
VCCSGYSLGFGNWQTTGICSTCCGGQGVNRQADCPNGETCAIPPYQELVATSLPMMCELGKAAGIPGAPCLAPADCASHSCDGVIYNYGTAPCLTGTECTPLSVLAGQCR